MMINLIKFTDCDPDSDLFFKISLAKSQYPCNQLVNNVSKKITDAGFKIKAVGV